MTEAPCDNWFVPVAPPAGAWIEMVLFLLILVSSVVAPHAGAWIEMVRSRQKETSGSVAPHAGAWIQITLLQRYLRASPGRSPCGERGLKYGQPRRRHAENACHSPCGERGLKYCRIGSLELAIKKP